MPSVKDLLAAPSPAPSAPPRSVSDLLGKPSPTTVAAMPPAPSAAPQAAAVSNEGGRIAYGAEVQGLQHAVYRTSLEDGYPEDVALDASLEAVRKYQAVGPGRNHGDIEAVLTARTNPMTAKKALALAFGPAAIPLPVDAPTAGERDEEYRRAVRARGEASWTDALAETWKGEDAPAQRAEDVKAAGMDKPWMRQMGDVALNSLTGGMPMVVDAVAHLLGGDIEGGLDTAAASLDRAGAAVSDKDVRTLAAAPHQAATGLLLQSGGPQALAAAARGLGLDDPDTAIGTAIQFVDDATPREDADAALKRYYETGDRSAVDALPWRALPSRLQANGRPDMGLLVNAVRDGVLKDDPAAEPLRKALAENRTAPAYLAAQAERLPLASLRLVQPDLWPTSADLDAAWTARSKALEWSGGKQGDAAVRLMGAGLLQPVGEGGELVFRPSRFAEIMRLMGTAPEMIYEADVRSVTAYLPGAAPAGETSWRAKIDQLGYPTKARVEFAIQSGAYDDWLRALGLEGSDAFAALRDPESRWADRVMADLYLPDFQGPGYRAAYERAGGDPESVVAKGLGTADIAVDLLLPAEELVAGPAAGALAAGLRGKAAMRAAREAGLPARPAWRTTLAAVAPVLEGKTDGIEAVNKRMRHEIFDGLLTGRLNPDAVTPQGREQIVNLFREAGVQNPEDEVAKVFDYVRDRRARILDATAVVMEKGGPATQRLRASVPYFDRGRDLDALVAAGNLTPRERDVQMRVLEVLAFRAFDQGRVATPEEFFARHRWERGVDADVSGEALASREGGTTRGSIGAAPRTRADVEASPEFRAWFGGSRVVDEKGAPLVVYHGSRGEPFTEFYLHRAGQGIDKGWLGRGFYFSDRQDVAEGYAGAMSDAPTPRSQGWRESPRGGSVLPAYLALRNPLMWGNKGSGVTGVVSGGGRLPEEIHDAVLKRAGLVALPDGVASSRTGRRVDGWTAERDAEAALADAVREEMIARGYDGVVAEIRDRKGAVIGREYVALDSAQVKSATGNRGTFDPRDPNILHSEEGGAVQGSIQPDRPTAPTMAEINEGRRRTWGAADPNERARFLRAMRERTLAALVAGEDVPDEVVVNTGLQRDAALLTTGRITVPPGAQDVTPDGPVPAPLAGKTFDAVEWNPPEPGETEGLALLSLGGRQVGSARLAPARLRRDFGHLLGGRLEDAVRADPGSVAYASVADVRPGRADTLYSEEGGVVRGAIEPAAEVAGAAVSEEAQNAYGAIVTPRSPDPALAARTGSTVHGAVTPERTARWLIRLFSTGDIGTAFHEGGHLLDLMMGEGWTRQAAKALGVPDTQIAAAFDRGDATATREIRERIAEGVRRVLRNRMRPGGRGSNLLRDFTDTLGDVWARVRGVPEVAPREFRAFWDAALRPDDHARPAAIALVDERLASREMRPPVFAPDDPAAEVAAMPVLKAGQRREAGRVDAHPSNVLRAALGLKAGQATADPLELLANALAYAGTERARRTWGFGKTMALTTRVALPEKRAKQVLEDVDRHRRAALGGKDLRPTVVDGVEVMDLDADQQAGLARLVAEVQESPLGETLSDRFDATERPNPAHAAWAAEMDALRARLAAAERATSPEWVAWRDRQFSRNQERTGAAERLRSLQANPRADDPEWADEVEALRERMLEMDRAPVEAEPPRAGPDVDAARAAVDAHAATRPPETLSGVDLGRVTVEDYNSLMAHLVEIRSGAGAFREREAERAAASGALRLWGKAIEAVERTDLAPMVNWLRERFVASHAEDRYLSPAKRDVIYSVKRELGEVGKDLRREGRAIEGAMRRGGVKDFTAVDILRRVSEGMPPEVVPVEMLDELASLAGDLGNPTIERVAQRADDLHRLFTGARISSATQTADEVASLAVLDQVGRRLANGMLLEMALDDLGLTLAKTEDAMSIVMEGLRRRVHAVDDAASDILVGFAGSPDRAVLTGIQNEADRRKILHRVYDAWYSGRWDEILVQTTREGQAAAGPRFDQGAAAATVLLRLKARRILGTLARRMAEAGVLGDVTDVARPGLSFDRAYTLGALEGGREVYIRSVVGYIEAITGWKDTPTIVLPRDGGTPEIHPAPGRRTADGREDLPAYMDAMRFLNQWGFRTGKGTWATLDIPGGSVVMVPELTRKPIEEVVNAAAPSGMAWRLGGDKLGDVTRAASEAAPPTVTVQAINAAVAAIRGTYGYTLGMMRAGLTTGLLLPNPAFYVGQLIGGVFQLYQGMGAAKALSIMARPLLPTEDGAVIRRVLARMWADGDGAFGYDIMRPADRWFLGRGGHWWSDQSIAEEVARAGLNSSLPKSEAMDSIIRDLKRMEPGWFNAIMRAPRAWQRGLVEAATAIDNYYRVATFVDGLRRGQSAVEAAEKARSVAFDYNALTDFEKQRIRPVVMFYSFMRRNQDLFWRTLLENPSRVMGQLRMLRGLQQQELGEDAPLFMPDYMDGRAVIRFRQALADGRAENEGRGMALLSPRLPVGDAVGFWLELIGLAEMDPEAGRDLLNRLDPMIKAPIVLGTNTDLLTGREVDAYNTVPNWLVEMDRNATGGMLVDDIFQVRPAQWRDAMSEGYPGAPRYQAANGKMWWLYRNLLQTPGAGRSTDTITAMQRADLGESVIGEHGAVQGLVDLTRWFAERRGETPTATEPDTETARPWLTEREEMLGLLGIRPQRIEERDQVIARLVQERAREVAREEGRVRATREHRYGR